MITNGVPHLLAGFNAVSVNNRGEVLGTVRRPNEYTTYAAIWRDGVLTTLPGLPDIENMEMQPKAFNDNGDVVGIIFYRDPITQISSGTSVLWKNGQAIRLDSMGIGVGAPTAINNFGQIVGYGSRQERGFGLQSAFVFALVPEPGVCAFAVAMFAGGIVLRRRKR